MKPSTSDGAEIAKTTIELEIRVESKATWRRVDGLRHESYYTGTMTLTP